MSSRLRLAAGNPRSARKMEHSRAHRCMGRLQLKDGGGDRPASEEEEDVTDPTQPGKGTTTPAPPSRMDLSRSSSAASQWPIAAAERKRPTASSSLPRASSSVGRDGDGDGDEAEAEAEEEEEEDDDMEEEGEEEEEEEEEGGSEHS